MSDRSHLKSSNCGGFYAKSFGKLSVNKLLVYLAECFVIIGCKPAMVVRRGNRTLLLKTEQ